MKSRSNEKAQSGVPVDSSGGPTIDPTKNVLDLVEAAVKRIDDILSLSTKRLEEKIDSEKSHTRELMQLRSEHIKDLREAEAKRIDAIRAVDVNAVTATNERATAQAAVLANQVTTTAETLRNLVATTASATAVQLDQLTKLLTDRIAALEKAQYEGQGKERVTDPILQQLLTEMKATRESMGEGKGKSQGINATVVYILMAMSFIGGVIGIISFFR